MKLFPSALLRRKRERKSQSGKRLTGLRRREYRFCKGYQRGWGDLCECLVVR